MEQKLSEEAFHLFSVSTTHIIFFFLQPCRKNMLEALSMVRGLTFKGLKNIQKGNYLSASKQLDFLGLDKKISCNGL